MLCRGAVYSPSCEYTVHVHLMLSVLYIRGFDKTLTPGQLTPY